MFWKTSARVRPVAVNDLAIKSAELLMSFREKKRALGFPVVPLEV